MRRCVSTLLLTGALIAPRAGAQQAPPLPLVSIDLFPPAAREAVSRAYRDAELRPQDPDAAGALGRTLHAWEQWDAAHQAYARAQSLAPRVFAWAYLDAVVLLRLARHADAAAALRRAAALDGKYLPLRLKLAEALFEAGKHADAAQLASLLVKEPDAEPVGRLLLGRVAAAEGHHAIAVDHLRRAVALFPSWGAAHYALGLSYRALDRREDARRALDLHARYGPQWPPANDPVLASVEATREDGPAVLARAVTLAQRGDVEGAIAAHHRALERDPGLFQAHANLIGLYGRVGEWARAEAHYQAALAPGAEVGDVHYDYGVLLGLQQRWGEAAEAYRRAIAVNPWHPVAHNNLGEALERQGRLPDALAAYREALDRQPEFRLARFNTGRMLLAAGKAADAVAMLVTLAESRDEQAPRFLFALAVAQTRAGYRDEGVRSAAEAHRLAIKHGQSALAATIAHEFEVVK